MALTSFSSHSIFGSRCESMFTFLGDSLFRDLQEDNDVKLWMKSIESSLIVKTTSAVLSEADFYGKTALNVGAYFVQKSLLPITFPLSKVIKNTEKKLKPCPFPPAKGLFHGGKGDLAFKKLSIFEKASLGMTNLKNKLTYSKSKVLRNSLEAMYTLGSLPFKFLSEPSKEQLVQMAIQMYFPTYNTAEFRTWVSESFLPVLLERYLKGNITKLAEVASPQIVKQRQMAIADYVISKVIIRSRLLSVADVEIVDFEFIQRSPVVLVKCSADFTHEMRNQKNEVIEGGEQQIQHCEYVVAISINADGPVPVWKANEIHAGSSNTRI